MARTASIALIELFGLVDRISAALPADIEAFFEQFVVINLSSTQSVAAVFHRGTLQPSPDPENTSEDRDSAFFDIGIGRLELPLVHSGIAFQLALTRAPTIGTLEPLTANWQIDLVLDVFALTLDGLQPAIHIPQSGTFAQHLLRDPIRKDVRISGQAVLRITSTVVAGSAPAISVALVDQPDPLAPGTPSGTVTTINVDPPHFFIGDSEFGLSVGRLQFDFSTTFSPANVLAAGQDPGWQGVLINEATLYAPRNLPTIGDLSGGVKNVLIGSPTGLQGEFEIQFGRTLLAPVAFRFEQTTTNGVIPLAIAAGQNSDDGSASATVLVTGEPGDELLINGALQSGQLDPDNEEGVPGNALRDWSAVWHWPDGLPEEADFSAGTLSPGQSLRVTPVEFVTLDGETEATRFEHPEIVYRFVINQDNAPQIDASVAGQSFANVVHAGGRAEDLADIELSASTIISGATHSWQLSGDSERYAGSTLRIGDTAYRRLHGQQLITLTESLADAADQMTRMQLQILDDGEVLIGTEQGVFNASNDDSLSLSAVEQTFDLSDFHLDGLFNSSRAQATLDSTATAQVLVPDDALARVAIVDADIAPVVALDRHVQILMDFDTDDELRWGDHRPAGTPVAFSQSDLLAWASRYTDSGNERSEFLVIGRCGDLGDAGYNATLATDRAVRAVAMLTSLDANQVGTAIDSARVAQRGEQSSFSPTSSGHANGIVLEDNDNIDLDTAEQSDAVNDTTLANGGWLIKAENDTSSWPPQRDPTHPSEAIRERYRRVDIYAVTGLASDSSALPDTDATLGTSLRRSLVPATGRQQAPIPAASPAIDYRVRIRIVWDSPTVEHLKDAIPTLAEAEFAWSPQEVSLPEVNENEISLGQNVLTLFANWSHDTRTGYTKTTLGIRSEGDDEGLLTTDNKTLSAALAFGPALLSGLDEGDQIGSAGRIGAFIAAVGFAETGFLTNDTASTLLEAAFETEMRSISDPGPDLQIRVVTSYVCSLGIETGVFGLRTDDGYPLKVRYNDVGIEYDTSVEGWDRFGLTYDTNTLQIVDPGRWQINGVLGNLMRIVEVTVGRGSIWFEGRIAVALEIGIFEITEAAIRLSFDGVSPIPAFELRGLVIRCNVPGVLEGEGSLRIEQEFLPGPNGEDIETAILRAAIDASVIPLGLGVSAGLGMTQFGDNKALFLELFLGVQFATPLPLAQSGMAIYGFTGLFTMNGSRDVDASEPDPVVRELDWWQRAPGSKYRPELGQYALGVGVVVGTFPDTSFCMSCSGMVVVAFPDPEVILGVEINIIEVPDTTVKDTKPADAPSATITGLIIIDDEAVTVAASANYTIPEVLEVKVPFAAYFPYPGSGRDVYVRIGSDGVEGRSGEPVSLTLLPGTLDARAWTYLMIEQGGLQRLGGDDRFNFDGFAVGFGAGWEINWSAEVIKLHASAKMLLGFGTAPLLVKGGVFVDGELDMVAVSIAAHGELIAEIRDNRQSMNANDPAMFVRLDGEFCGEVDLLFFSLSGCVGISIGSELSQVPPPPPSPVRGVSLVDRRDRIMGTAIASPSENNPAIPQAVAIFGDTGSEAGAVTVDDNQMVWPDTTPIIHFTHFVENGFSSGQFSPGPTPSQDQWWGSAGLKYAYRIDFIELRYVPDPGSDNLDNAFHPSVWTTSPYRQPDASSATSPLPSEHEGPNLKLLDWNPWAWVVNMSDGGASQDGDPVQTIEDLCDPLPIPRQACVYGRDARNKGVHRVRLRQRPPAPGPYPSRFHVTGEPVIELSDQRFRGRALQVLVETGGGFIESGRIAALPVRVNFNDTDLAQGYQLPTRCNANKSGVHHSALPWWGTFDCKLVRPSVVLMLCEDASGELPDGVEEVCEDFRGVAPLRDVNSLAHNGLLLRPVGPDDQLTLFDGVDQTGETPVLGNDGSAEIGIPNAGLDIELRSGCDRVTVHVWPFDHALKADAFAANGQQLDGDSISPGVSQPRTLRFQGNGIDRIARVRISGGNGEALVFKVCCARITDTEPPEPIERCIDFGQLRLSGRAVASFNHQGLHVESLSGKADLRLQDRVNASIDPHKPGRDRVPELRFFDSGVRIKLPEPCTVVALRLMLFNDTPVKIIALDTLGKQVDAISEDKPDTALQLTLRGPNIAVVELLGGDGAAALYEICYIATVPTGMTPAIPALTTQARVDASVPVNVTGLIDERLVDAWKPNLLEDRTHAGQRCRLVEFTPVDARVGPWDGFQILSETDQRVLLVAACGVDQSAVDKRDTDEQVRATLRQNLETAIAAQPDKRHELLLDPGTTLELEVVWQYQAFRADDPDQNPPSTASGTWLTGGTEYFRFAIADDQTAANPPQDGLNEYRFDARDIERYLIGVEPADDRAVHFTDDPIWAHFEAGHVEQLLDLYGRELTIEVRRTDPPPQPTPELRASILEPILLNGQWTELSNSRQALGNQRLNASTLASTCLSNGAPFDGASLAMTGDLEPLADYDLRILAPMADDNDPSTPEDADSPVVLATRFETSRYANPRALLDALGFTESPVSPYLPDDLFVPDGAVLPTADKTISDSALFDALAALDADTLPLPKRRPRTYLFWQVDSDGLWHIHGMLLDSLEPLHRERTVIVDGATRPDTGIRCSIDHVDIGDTRFDISCANNHWTRVLFTPNDPVTGSAPVTLPASEGPEHTLVLHLSTSDGDQLGKRRVRAVPSILEREAL